MLRREGGSIAFKRRRKVVKRAVKVVKKRRESIPLNPEYWLRNTADIRLWSEANKPADGLCPVLKYKPTRWTCDHDHFDLKVRGMLSQPANTWEGYVVKYFQKYCSKYTDLSVSEALRNLADYLETDYWLANKLHHRGIETQRKYLERLTKDQIAIAAKTEFDLRLDPTALTQEQMIVLYLEAFIKKHEETVWK